MDPVTKILVDRERARPRLLPWVVLAVMLHAGLAAATYLVGRRAASRPVQLPVVAVKLVRPEPAARRAQASSSRRRSTPVPQPTGPPATPAPRPTAVPTALPADDRAPPSSDAMRSTEQGATPAPAPPPPPAAAAGGSGGLSVGSAEGGGNDGIPSDFHFTYYVERMLALIESRWYKPSVPAGTRARVRFIITKGGRLEGIRLEESSGVASFDRAALRAIYAANPLPPLPPAYRKPSLTIHLSFTE